MGAIPYALSVTISVDSVGAKAGFAAIIGVALWCCCSSRRCARPRRCATAPRRPRSTSSSWSNASRSWPAALLPRAPAPRPLCPLQPRSREHRSYPLRARASRSPQPRGRGASRTVRAVDPVGAPAGVGAPALSSATRLIPSADEARSRSAPPVPAQRHQSPPGSPQRRGRWCWLRRRRRAPPGPPPATAAGGANGGRDREPPPLPAPAPPPASARPAEPPRPPRLARSRAAAVDPSRPSRIEQLLTRSRGADRSRRRRRRGGRRDRAAESRPRAARVPAARAPPAPRATARITARAATAPLSHPTCRWRCSTGPRRPTSRTTSRSAWRAAGYKHGHARDRDRSDRQTRPSSATAAGQPRRCAAVARSLKLGPASVQPVGQSNLAVACPPTSTCTAQVIVTVGADLTSAAGTR